MTDSELLYQAYLEKVERPSLLDPNFKHQCAFINDPAKLKAAFCTRRAAKSYTGGLYLTKQCQENAAVNGLYLGLTRASAKAIIWKDVLKDINTKNDIGMSFNGTELTATLPNESVIYVTGADADEDEMEKLLGRKYKIVIIDEAASFTVNLRRLIYGILKPATIDNNGTICLMGTSGNLTKGLFFDVTNGQEPGWKLFKWSAHDNPYVAKQWAEELEDIKTNRPLFMQTPLFRQWYLNEWVVDQDKLVYKFNSDRNVYQHLPHYSLGEWSYALGVDLGYDDDSAFVVVAFHEHDKNLYIVESSKRKKMDITDVANHIKQYQVRYSFFKIIIDGANKQAVEEIVNRHQIPLAAADKTGKSDFIEIMNAEFIQGKIKINHFGNEALLTEYPSLIWDEQKLERTGKREEHPNCDNHAADAALYIWRYCFQYLSEKPKDHTLINSKEKWISHTTKLMEDSLERQIENQQAAEQGLDSFNTGLMDSQEDVLNYFLNKRRR